MEDAARLLQLVVNGAAAGCIYGLIALGFVLWPLWAEATGVRTRSSRAQTLRANEEARESPIDALREIEFDRATGKLSDEEAKGLTATGFDGFLRKPFHVRQVIEAVEDAMAVVY